MSSWWKCRQSSSLTHRAASSSSRLKRYSSKSWSISTFSSATGRPSPGPQTFSKRALQCSRLRRLTAFSTTASPGRSLFCSERKAGGSTSSTTARARNEATMVWASGTSVMRSSRLSSKEIKPASMSLIESGVGCKHVSKRLVNSRSRGPLSMAKLMAFFGISALYSLHPSSSRVRMTSSVSQESKYSFRASSSWNLNSCNVNIGPYTAFSVV
mmetsp:Transcript_32501/g.67773  ORF Transcript_32501/g.67773 Transcript_32501/m.67773 type:complete len:213 (-) Transcript_32501:575-1213(-)